MALSQQVYRRGTKAGCLWTACPLFPDWPRQTTKQIILHSSSLDMNYKGHLSSATALVFTPFIFPAVLFLFGLKCLWGGESVLLTARLCAWPSRLSACWQRRGFVQRMRQAFCCLFRLLLNGELPTVPSSARYLHLQGIYKVPSARREWQSVIGKQLKRQVLGSFHLCLLCVPVCTSAWCLGWCLNNGVNGLQWQCGSLKMNWRSGFQMRRTGPLNNWEDFAPESLSTTNILV